MCVCEGGREGGREGEREREREREGERERASERAGHKFRRSWLAQLEDNNYRNCAFDVYVSTGRFCAKVQIFCNGIEEGKPFGDCLTDFANILIDVCQVLPFSTARPREAIVVMGSEFIFQFISFTF